MMDDCTCCLCGLPYDRIGNNPAPLAQSGRCCDACNEVVTEARISMPTIVAEIERVEAAMLSTNGMMRQCAVAAICASRGPVLWVQRQHERAQLVAMIERDDV
jgi:hypothetical protein